MDKSMRAELAELWEFYFQIEPCLVYQPQTSTQISATYKHQVTFCVWTQISATYKHEQHKPQVTFCVWTQISATFLTKHVNTVQFDSSNAYIGQKYKLKNSQIRDFWCSQHPAYTFGFMHKNWKYNLCRIGWVMAVWLPDSN